MPAKKIKAEPVTHEQLTQAYGTILGYLRANTTNAKLLENFKGTEDRCVRALMETCKSDAYIVEELKHIIGTSFPVDVSGDQEGMVNQGPISINSHCPHHLYPVRYSAYVSYVPKNGQVLGLSKLARIAKIMGRRPVLHEQLASDIADTLYKNGGNHPFPAFESAGSAVMLVGMHSCMSCRGVEEDAMTSVVELRGCYWQDDFEGKFYNAVRSIRDAKPFRD